MQEQDGRIDAVTNSFASDVADDCNCGFSSTLVTNSVFRCFPDSSTAVTFRATLTDSRFLPHIQNWLQRRGFVSVQNVLVAVDSTCQVEISSLADSECVMASQPTEPAPTTETNDTPVIPLGPVAGGVVGGVFLILLIIFLIYIALKCKSRRKKLTVQRMTS